MNQIPNIEEVVEEFKQWAKSPARPEDETKTFTDNIADWLHHKLTNFQQTHHQQLQKAREQRKGWKGYVAVDPKADNYKYSPVFSDRKGAELWVKGKEISGLEVVEVDILLVDHSELDKDNK